MITFFSVLFVLIALNLAFLKLIDMQVENPKK